MKRRSFLALLGLAPMAPKVVAKLAEEALNPKRAEVTVMESALDLRPGSLNFMGVPILAVDYARDEDFTAIMSMRFANDMFFISNPPVYVSEAGFTKIKGLCS